MSQADKRDIQRRVDLYGATLRNTPGFWGERKRELKAMIQQLGDPHVFATNSHADTHCPYLQRFIKAWAAEDFAPDTYIAIQRYSDTPRYIVSDVSPSLRPRSSGPLRLAPALRRRALGPPRASREASSPRSPRPAGSGPLATCSQSCPDALISLWAA